MLEFSNFYTISIIGPLFYMKTCYHSVNTSDFQIFSSIIAISHVFREANHEEEENNDKH